MKAGSTAQNVCKHHVGGQRMCRDQPIAGADRICQVYTPNAD
jgi:hypothetical protein